MKRIILSLAIAVFTIASGFKAPAGKLVSKNGYASFYSHTSIEDIKAENFKTVSTIDVTNGEVVFSIPMQSFEFEKALMQKHFNSPKFLDTKKFPKAKFKGKITNLNEVNFAKNGTYNATAEGDLTLHGVTKHVKENGTITVAGNKVTLDANMKITLADYGITFSGGKPSTNIAKVVDVKIKSEYTAE